MSVAETLARDAGPVEELARRAAESFAAPLAASTAAFLVTARLARRSAYALGVSCATPMVGAVMSVCAVGGSAALAGQAAREATSWASAGRGDARVGGRASWLFPSGFGRARADAPWDERRDDRGRDTRIVDVRRARARPKDGDAERRWPPGGDGAEVAAGERRALRQRGAEEDPGSVDGQARMPPLRDQGGSGHRGPHAAEQGRVWVERGGGGVQEGTQSLWTRAWQAVGGCPSSDSFRSAAGAATCSRWR